MAGKLYLCATPIGNLGDISLRCLEALKNADIIAAEDTRRTLGLLNHFEISKPLTSYHEHNKKEKGEYIISLLKDGKNVALVSDAGTVAISDPGEDLVSLCIENSIDTVPIPGPVAAINALIISGISTRRFAFEGFLSVNKRHRFEHLESLKNDTHTLIFYEAPHKLKTTLKDLYDVFGDRKIALVRELTKIHEEAIRTTLSDALLLYADAAPRGEFVIVIEGASEAAKPEENPLNALTVNEHVNRYISKGMMQKEAIKQVSLDRQVPKRDIYNEYHRV
ncbi:MAG: 16S rRNA (cytidine(1402)-2'-O)-methyltransferase [Firmicutes bacterium]|nr:16S rRNA (cytidine(1402)-2'-O)-methyltransferase [Bacillota bacterium]